MTTILIVDDHAQNRYLLHSILAAASYTVAEAANGAEALALARQNPPDLIVADILMPVMDGYVLCREWQQDALLHNIPFVFCTATYTDARDEAFAYQLGAARFIVKPVEGADLVAILRTVLAEYAAGQPHTAMLLPEQESVYYRLYNEVLIHKLEEKVAALEQSNQALRESESFVRATLDGLSAHIAILDETGTILAVNQSWRAFGTANPPLTANVCEGANYLAVCDAAAGINANEAAEFAAAIRAVLAGEQESAFIEYPCHAPHEKRWFIGRITRFPGDGPPRAVVAHENITKRKLAESALGVSEQALERSQAVAHVGHWTWDTQTNRVYWSDEMKRIFGVDPQTFAGDLDAVIQQTIHPDDWERVFRINEAVLKEGRPAETEYRVIWPDGSVHVIWAVPGERVMDATGNIIQLSGIVQDITVRAAAEELVRLQAAALAAAANGIVITDINGLIEWVNPAFTALTGYSAEESLGRNPRDLVRSGQHDDAFYRKLWDTILAGQVWRGELVNRRKDGSIYTEEQTITPVHNAQGIITHFVGIKQDVTERVRSAQALLESEARYRSLFENSHSVMLLIDPDDGAIVDANPAAAFFYGWTRAELCHKRIGEINTMPPDAVQAEMNRARQAQRNHFFFQHRLADGTLRDVEVFSGQISMGGRKLLYSIVHDITERKRAEEALRRSEASLAQAQAIAGLGSWERNITDGAGAWSVEMFRLLGCDPALGMPSFAQSLALFHPEDRDLLAMTADAVQATRMPAEIELRSDPGRGPVRLFSAHMELGSTKQGEQTRLVGTLLDITARRQAEAEQERLFQQLQAKAEQLSQVMNSVPEGVLLLDAKQCVLLANSKATAYLKKLTTVASPPAALNTLGERNLDTLLTSPPSGQWHLLQVDRRSYEVIARPVETGPMPAGWVLVIRDVTEERTVRQQLQRQERLAALGQLAAGIAHDFNNMMSVIVMSAQILDRTLELTARDRERLGTIEQQTMRAAQMIRQILDFSRAAVLERQQLDLLPILKEQIKLLQRTLPESIVIQLESLPGEYRVRADPTRMEQVVMNLAVNARDAMPEGGELRFKLAYCQVTTDKVAPIPGMTAGAWVCLTVADTGAGIPEHVLEHIFEPFFTTKDPGQGTGLGLAQVHGIIGQHDGAIAVESQVGAGTTFTIYLPELAVVEGGKPLPPIAANTPLGHAERVLIVEDDAALRKSMVDMLTLLNYQVQAVSNGAEALELLAAPDAAVELIISDIVMPKLSGTALFIQLYEQGNRIPFILMSGHAFGANLDTLRERGLQEFLPKPPSIEVLSQAIVKALHGKATSLASTPPPADARRQVP